MSSVLARAVVVLGGDSSQLDQVMSTVERRMKKVGERMEDVGKSLSTKVTLPLVALGGVAIKSFGDQEDAIARTNAVLKASGGVAGVTAEHLAGLASSLQDTTTYADEVTQSAMALLLSFQSVRNEAGKGNDIFDRTVKVAQDLSELMGRDLQGAMLMVGKSMEDPLLGLTALRRVGVIFDDQTIETIKNLNEQGRVLEAQKMILAGLEGRIGGLSTAMAKTPLGQFKQAWNELDNTLEGMGGILADMIALPVAGKVKEWAKEFGGLSTETQSALVLLGTFVALIGPALVGLGTVLKVGALLSVVFSGLANAIGPLIISFQVASTSAAAFTVGTTSILAPVALLVAALGALVVAGIQVARHWTWLRQQDIALWAAIKDSFFKGVDWVLAALQKMMAGLVVAGESMKMLPGPVGLLGTALSALGTPLTAAAGKVDGLRAALSDLHQEDLVETNNALVRLEQELMATGEVAKKTGDIVKKVFTPPPAAWLKGAQEALKTFTGALRQAAGMEKLLGRGFDETSAQAEAYRAAIEALVAAGVPLDARLTASGKTLRQLAAEYQILQQWASDAQAAEDAFAATMERARAAVEAARTPLQGYNQTVWDLNAALAAGKISWEEYEAAIKKARETLDSSKQKSEEFKRAVADMVVSATDAFVEFAFTGKGSFKDFVRSALIDLTKLIIKIQLMKWLMGDDGKGGLLGKIPGFATGGFLPAGQIGLVGERGPELVMAGRAGVRIAPMPDLRAAPALGPNPSGGGGVNVIVNVSALDSRDVSRFFEENEGLVAGAMLRASQRSSALRRRLVG